MLSGEAGSQEGRVVDPSFHQFPFAAGLDNFQPVELWLPRYELRPQYFRVLLSFQLSASRSDHIAELFEVHSPFWLFRDQGELVDHASPRESYCRIDHGYRPVMSCHPQSGPIVRHEDRRALLAA